MEGGAEVVVIGVSSGGLKPRCWVLKECANEALSFSRRPLGWPV